MIILIFHLLRGLLDSSKMRQNTLLSAAVFAVALCLVPGRTAAQESGPAPAREFGTIAGRVSMPPDVDAVGPVEVVLMAPRWATLWNGDVQQRLDEYFNRYHALVGQDRSLFERLSDMARRDAAASVLWQMQRTMGAEFTDVIREAPPDGRFEFTGIPFGEYKVMVLARAGERNLIWTETVDIHSPIPHFVEIPSRTR